MVYLAALAALAVLSMLGAWLGSSTLGPTPWGFFGSWALCVPFALLFLPTHGWDRPWGGIAQVALMGIGCFVAMHQLFFVYVLIAIDSADSRVPAVLGAIVVGAVDVLIFLWIAHEWLVL